MEKPILATTLSGLFIKSEPWKKAHFEWFPARKKEIIAQGKDTSAIDEWEKLAKTNPEKEKEKYFDYVIKVMKLLYPDLSKEERNKIARDTYFDSTVEHLKKHPEAINKDVVDYFSSIKEKYRIALITTNTQSALERILFLTNIKIFDIIEASVPEEKDDKKVVFNRFIEKYGKPALYIGGDKEDALGYCVENDIPCIYANFENKEEIACIETAYNLDELKSKIENL